MSCVRVSALVFVVLLLLAVALWVWPLMTNPSPRSVPPACFGLDVSYVGNGFSYSLDKPLFGAAQYVLKPGSYASIDVRYGSAGADVKGLMSALYQESDIQKIEYVWIVGGINGGLTSVPAAAVGLTITLANMSFPGSEAAMLKYNISASEASPPATLLVPVPEFCSNPLFLTVGYLPYLGPLPLGIIQPITLVAYLVVAFLIGGCAHLFLRRRG